MAQPDPIAARYASLTDDELLEITRDFDQLTREAGVKARAELERRGLSHAKPADNAMYPAEGKVHPAIAILSQPPDSLRTIAYTVGQIAITCLGVSVAAAALFNFLRVILSPFIPRSRLAPLAVPPPYFLFVMTVAVLNGYLLSRRRGKFWTHWSAEVVWILPALWLSLNMLSYHQASTFEETRWQHFFWSQDPAARRAQFSATLPFLASVTYAIGHLLGKKPDVPTP